MDRRVFIMGTVAGGVVSTGCDGNGPAAALLAKGGEAGSAVQPPLARPVAERYRTERPLLFLSPPTGLTKTAEGSGWETAARASVSGPKAGYGYGGTGPTFSHVDLASDWAWRNRNGDWIDAAGTSQGPAPHWNVAANNVSAETFTYAIDATRGVKAAYEGKRWNAYIVRGANSGRSFTTPHHASPPFMTVTYEDGKTARLKCTAAVGFEPSSSYATGGAPIVQVAQDRVAAIEFERPTQAVRSAILTLPVVQHATGPGSISGFLVDPPLNTEPVLPGLAVAYPRDSGIRVHAQVIFAHSYADGTKESDWIEQKNLNVYNTAFWSPHVFDPNAKKDMDRLPFIHQGRWTKTKGNASLVASNYGGEGFEPLAPGLGAIRVNIPGSSVADGGAVGYGGGFGCDLAMYLPDDMCGVLDEIYIRYYLRLGIHAPEYLANTKMYRTEPGAQAQYAQHGGKFGIGASHWTHYGGNNNIGGGNIGWTNRNGWTEYPPDVVGGGVRCGVHSWDMIGYDRHFGSIGGLGAAMYPGHWYCLESRLKLNTVDTSTSPFNADPAKNLDDAELDIWLDGRKVLEMRNFSYRKLPLDYGGPESFDRKIKLGRTPLDKKFLVPIRQLGVTAITMNDYNGGVMPAGADRAKFYAGLVVAKKPIGPMAGL